MSNGTRVIVCNGGWTIETRPRNNHSGHKVWILRGGKELYSLDERGLRQRAHQAPDVPQHVMEKAESVWLDCTRVA